MNALRQDLAGHWSIDASAVDFLTFADPNASVRVDVERIRESPRSGLCRRLEVRATANPEDRGRRVGSGLANSNVRHSHCRLRPQSGRAGRTDP
jgi:hypothetical protein